MNFYSLEYQWDIIKKKKIIADLAVDFFHNLGKRCEEKC